MKKCFEFRFDSLLFFILIMLLGLSSLHALDILPNTDNFSNNSEDGWSSSENNGIKAEDEDGVERLEIKNGVIATKEFNFGVDYANATLKVVIKGAAWREWEGSDALDVSDGTSSFSYALNFWRYFGDGDFTEHIFYAKTDGSGNVILNLFTNTDVGDEDWRNRENSYIDWITISAVNVAPIIISPNNGNTYTGNVVENSLRVATVNATDLDSDQTLSYNLSGSDASLFTISSSGEINFITAPDFESPTDSDANNIYNFTVTVLDNGTPVLSDTQDFIITVTDLNENPIADYRFDECFWDGTSAQVKDSSGNAYDGRAINGADTEDNATAGGGLCRVGYFDGVDDYVEQDDIYDYLKTTASLSFWIKTQQIGNDTSWSAPGIIGVEKSGSGDDIFWGWIDASGHIGITKGNTEVKSTTVINDNVWHHIVLTRNSISGGVEIYIDKILDTSGTSETGDVGTIFNRIGSISDTGSTPTFFKGWLDEIKIFDSVISSVQVTQIYDNEKIGKNYDETDRVCGSCGCRLDLSVAVTPLEFEGAEIILKKSNVSPHWTSYDFNKTFLEVPIVFVLPSTDGNTPAAVRIKEITKSGFSAIMAEPQGENGPHKEQNINFLAVNEGVHKIGDTYFQVGKINTQKVQSKAESKYEWEKISSIFSSYKPAVVAQIQSLKNEKGLVIPDSTSSVVIRSIPFLTTAIVVTNEDVNLSLERSETNEGAVDKNETIGYMIAEPNVHDHILDDFDNNVTFETIVKENYFIGWTDSCKEVNFVNNYNDIPLIAANKNTKNEDDGGWVRRCSLTAGIEGKIGLKIDEDRSLNNERTHIPETASIFAFSGTIVIRAENNETTNYRFDTWDTFRNINDRNISTKISAQDFSLTLASLNETNNAYQDFNGTVCSQINGNSGWVKSDFRDINTTTVSFNMASATKDTYIDIVWKSNVDANCPLLVDDNSTTSSDHFSIRPKQFDLSLSTPVKAGESFSFNVNANNDSDNPTNDYNATGVNVDVNISDSTKICVSNSADFNISSVSFINGVSVNSAKFDDVGEVDVNISDTTWASIDNDDTPQNCDGNSTHSIGTYICINAVSDNNVTIVPDKFQIVNYDFQRNPNNIEKWLYMADVSDMNMTVKYNVQAQNETNGTTQNFDANCYASNVGTSINFTSTNSDGNVSYYQSINTISTIGHNKGLSDFDFSGTINDNNFTNGDSSEVIYALNVYRQYYNPKNPMDINITEVNTTSSSNDIGLSDNNGSSFYFGRVTAKDIKTTQTNAEHSAEIEVYDDSGSSYVNGFEQNSLKWYKNNNHNVINKGNITEINATQSSTLKNIEFSIDATDIANPNSGDINITIAKPTDDGTYTMHIKTQKWLWYIPSSLGSDYNESVNSNCTKHPCFKYTIKSNPSSNNISSGTFSGSDINVTDRGDYLKQGIKVYR